MHLFSGTFGLVEKALDAAALRHTTIASNIANADTPYYKRRDVSFAAELQKAVDRRNQSLSAYRTDRRHLPFKHQTSLEPRVIIDQHTMYNHNGNNVDMDFEMAELAKNQIKYHALIDRANGHLQKLRTVINEGR
ncbi:flagellar basal-body rod protein FlgB [Caldalkalibacillus uzonensis]|uniref:Flagellar basal body rod protein FlgB n=1 Tax=Caldalkalibacillus uzonensis TaxID=353224 RepID=A0ABU0CLF9_9BACI|nr:flagellar basal body rod protein FlgB [Caldalkalibacillus uzonensis]MDQ0337259.1 flagellar basal-body rod protein FlgB [Caldalkalibacillus uzonensis]